jgi:hypothetical protein
MKVTTDLRAGNVVEDATQFVGQVSDQAAGVISTANHQAKNMAGAVGDATNAVWQMITSPFQSS